MSGSSQKRIIMENFAGRLASLNLFKSIETNNIRIMFSDFTDDMLPAAQIIAVGEEPQHHHNRILRNWVLHLEVVMKSTENGTVTQNELWDMQDAIETQIGAQVQLKDTNTGFQIPGFIDINYRGTLNDLHIQEPYYTMRMEFICRFYSDYTGNN